jgi:hypothetical protein
MQNRLLDIFENHIINKLRKSITDRRPNKANSAIRSDPRSSSPLCKTYGFSITSAGLVIRERTVLQCSSLTLYQKQLIFIQKRQAPSISDGEQKLV